MKMEHKDITGFVERNRWFNRNVVLSIAEDYVSALKKHVGNLKTKKCKGVPYKRVHGRNIFMVDLQSKLYHPLSIAITHIRHATDATQLYNAVRQFNDRRIRLPWDTPQSKAWMDAYKGTGAFFTMQNLIRFTPARPLTTQDAGWTSTSHWRSFRPRRKRTGTEKDGGCWQS